MRKLMEAVETLEEGNVAGYASAITNLIDAMAMVIAEDYHASDTSLEIIINNVMHDATTEIKTRLPDRIKHYNEYMQNYKNTFGESVEESLNEEVYEAGEVTVIVTGGQVIVTHGTHRERLTLTMDEWEDFANMITQNRLKGGM